MKLLPLSVLLLPLAAFAADTASPSVEDRLQKLEAKLSSLTEENASLRQQLGIAAKSAPTFVTASGKEKKLSLGGYFQGQAEFGDAPDARFPAGDRLYVRRLRVGLKGSFAEHFDFNFVSDLGSNTLGSTTGTRAHAVDAFVTWTKFAAANVTVGQFKTPYGYEQLLPDTKVLTVERSLPNDQLTLSRQTGAMLSGATADKKFTYATGLFNGSGINTSVNDNDQFLYVGRVTGSLLQRESARLAAGANAFTSRDTGTGFTGRRAGLGLDLQAEAGPLGLYLEYFRTHFDRNTGADTNAHGTSVLGTCFLIPKTLQAIVRYEGYDPNRAIAGDDTDLWTLGLNYFIKGDDLKLSVNYLLGDPAGPLRDQGRLLTRLQVVF